VTEFEGRRLYEPATRRRLGRSAARRIASYVVVAAAVSGALIVGLHYEELPFLASWLGYCDESRSLTDCAYPRRLDWLAGVVGALAFGLLLAPLVPLAARRVRPSVYCRSCDSMGWVCDLVRSEGRCPRCGGGRFDHRSIAMEPMYNLDPVVYLPRNAVETDVAGTELLRRHRAGAGSREGED
jgi:hypothetical protein